MMNIAIDGPAGAGKTTLARMLAQRLGFIYVDTGALYRAVGYYVLQQGIDPKDSKKVEELLPEIMMGLRHTSAGQVVLLNGQDVSDKIRSEEISMAASVVSAIPAVRMFLLNLQKSIAGVNNVIMDGRDIGTVVLPDAHIKIFLTASPEDRARRRYEELKAKGEDADYEKVLAEIIQRDKQDSSRAIAPLKPAPNAILVDTTGFEIEQSLDRLYNIIKEYLNK